MLGQNLFEDFLIIGADSTEIENLENWDHPSYLVQPKVFFNYRGEIDPNIEFTKIYKFLI